MESEREELNEIVQKLCTSGTKILDTKLIKDLKALCKLVTISTFFLNNK